MPSGKNEMDVLPPPEVSGIDWQPIQMSHTVMTTSILWRGTTFVRGVVSSGPTIKKASLHPPSRKIPPPLPRNK